MVSPLPVDVNVLARSLDDDDVVDGAAQQSDDLDGRLKAYIFKKAPLLPQNELAKLFAEIRDLLLSAVRDISSNTFFAEKYLARNLFTPITTGMTQGRAYLQVEGKRKKSAATKWRNLPSEFPCPRQLYTASDHKFLCHAPAVLGSWVFDCRKPELGALLFDAGLMRARVEETVVAFLDETIMYPMWDLIVAQHISQVGGVTDAAIPFFLQMQETEKSVGGSLHSLSAVVRNVYSTVQKVVEIQHRIYNSYYKLVYDHAASISKVPHSIKDNFQNGIPGLRRAIVYYEPAKGSFSNFAKLWIRQSLLKSVKESANTIPVPSASWQKWKKIERARSVVYAKSGEVRSAEVAYEVGLPEKTIADVDRHIQTAFSLSLNYRLEDGEGNTVELVDTVPAPEPDSDPGDQAEDVDKPFVLEVLTKVERKLLGLMFGMWDLMPAGAGPRALTLEYLRQKWYARRRKHAAQLS